MNILEIISAICLILSCVFIIIMVLMQESKKGMSQAISGGSSDNFYQKNSGRTKEAKLAKATKTAAILFFVVTLVVNVFAIYYKGGSGSAESDTITSYDVDFDTGGMIEGLLPEGFNIDGVEIERVTPGLDE